MGGKIKSAHALGVATEQLRARPKVWLVTGVAGFIGSNLLEHLLRLGQQVIGLDNLSTGRRENLEEVRGLVSAVEWSRFTFLEGDIRQLEDCRRACANVDFVLHHAALGSVPRSLDNPIATNETNVTGFLNMLVAARDAKVRKFVFASSSSVYGDNSDLPKLEDRLGQPLSPYAVTKRLNEFYGRVFHLNYNFPAVGLRYFNVFGRRQNPDGPYAAVIPKWIAALCKREQPLIFGDGLTSRDFCYVKNVLQMNILAATSSDSRALGHTFNTALNQRTTLLDLYHAIAARFHARMPELPCPQPLHQPPRQGDIEHSQADISNGQLILKFEPLYQVRDGLDECVSWYMAQHFTGPTRERLLKGSAQTDKLSEDRGPIAVEL